jgi:glucose/arabinose dehydrogenase
MKKLSSLLAVAGVGAFASFATTLDANFQETTFATVGSQVTGMAWAPDSSKRLFVSRKGGVIQIVKDGTVLGTPFATVSPIFLNSECGLIGICFDPNFAGNGYVYVFVTVSSSEQQIIRYTAAGDVGTAKTILVADLPTAGQNHDGGGVQVGPDGKLYWAIGDNGNGTGVDANLTSLAAKVGRANRDGTVPADNPFVDGAGGNNDYIWARGFRNPFTITFQPDAGELWVNCVGTSYEQIFLVRAGEHAGWNDYENTQPAGYITPKIKYRTNGTDTRGIAASGAARADNIATFTTTSTHGFRQGEQLTISGVTDASFNGTVYVASVPSGTTFTAVQTGADATSGGGTAVTLDQGGAVSGGCFWNSTAVPEVYRGNFIYGDYNSGRLMRARLSSSNTVLSVDYFVTGTTAQIDTTIGPDGALYYAQHSGLIRRLAYTNYSGQDIIVTPTVLRMFEGGTTAFMVRLAQQPANSVTVNTSRTSGDAGINVSVGETLTFSTANWAVPQAVQLEAVADANATSSTAIITATATGLAAQAVTVYALDVSATDFSVGPVTRESGPGFGLARVHLSGEPGQRYAFEGSTNFLSPWTPLVTNTLIGSSTNYLDSEASNLPVRFYRARLVP